MNRVIWLGAIAAAFVCCIAGLVYLPDTPEREMARLNAEIDAKLPLGASHAEVREWLRNHSDFDDISGANTNLQGILAQAYRGYFWYWSGNLAIWFYFDDQDRLEKHHIEFEALAL